MFAHIEGDRPPAFALALDIPAWRVLHAEVIRNPCYQQEISPRVCEYIGMGLPVTVCMKHGQGKHHALPRNGFLYVTNLVGKNAPVINPATNTVVAAIPVGFFPSGFAFNPNTAPS
jgi:YVTN family beta-propeller protein